MNRRRSLWHKVAYACAIVVLLLPLSYLSQPRTTESPGGKLAQLRDEYGLSQADLGEIDPTSEALKLVTLGMRGPAANIMWQKANEYKKTEDWMGVLGGPGTNHPLAAQLHQRLAVSGLEPVLQHLGRVRRLSRPLLLGDEGNQFHHRRHPLQQERAAAALRRRLVHRPEDRPRRRKAAISQAVQGRRRLQRQSQTGRPR